MRLLAFIGAIAILAAIAAGVYFFGGFYDVAANTQGLGLIDEALERIREASISRRADDAKPPMSLDDPDTIKAGARSFAKLGCVVCHSAPGVQRDVFARRAMNPDPPGARTFAKDEPAELFWIIKNGIRMTAMPSFGKAGVKDDEIWQIAAFVKKSLTVSADDYKAWTAPPAAAPAAAVPPAAPPAAEAAPTPAPPAPEVAPAPAAPSGESH